MHRIALGAIPPTPNFATTTITASASQGISAKVVGGTGPKAGPYEMYRLEVVVEKTADQNQHGHKPVR